MWGEVIGGGGGFGTKFEITYQTLTTSKFEYHASIYHYFIKTLKNQGKIENVNIIKDEFI